MWPFARSDRAQPPVVRRSRPVVRVLSTAEIARLQSMLNAVRPQSVATAQRGGKSAPATFAITRSAPRVSEQDA